MVTADRQSVRIRDLRDPVHTEAARAAMKRAEHDPAELTVYAVLSAARDKTGLHDFGPDDFVERLRLWLDDAASDPNWTESGRAMLFETCVRYASSRLQLQDLITVHPEILDLQIRRPIIIVGPFRSGTTHLLSLLATDPSLRSLQFWESVDPIASAGTHVVDNRADPRFRRCAENWRRTQALLPHLGAMHALSPEQLHEEIELQGPDFASVRWDSIGHVPRAREHYLADDHTSHYEYMRTMLKALQWQRGPSRWVLKSPQHCEQLKVLLKVFPDATIVMTHRDPVAVVQSVATMQAYGARLLYQEVDVDGVCTHWLERIESMLRARLRDEQHLPSHSIVHVMYHDFIAGPIRILEKIYTSVGLEFVSHQRIRVSRALLNCADSRARKVEYDLLEDFGLDATEVRKRFRFYYDAFPVAIEVD